MFRKSNYFLLFVSISLFAMEPPEPEIGALGKRKREEKKKFEQRKKVHHALFEKYTKQMGIDSKELVKVLELEDALPSRIDRVPPLRELAAAPTVEWLMNKPSVLGVLHEMLRLPDDIRELIKQQINKFDTKGQALIHKVTNPQQVLNLKALGARFDLPDAYGMFPLHNAVVNGHVAVVETFLNLGIPVNQHDKNGRTPFFYTMNLGRNAIAKLLIEKYKVVLETFDFRGQRVNALSLAVRLKNIELMKILLKRISSFLAPHQIHDLIMSNLEIALTDISMLQIILPYLDQDRRNFALFYSVLKDTSPNIVKLLLQAGANPNYQWNGDSVLMKAIETRKEDIVKILLQAGAEVNLVTPTNIPRFSSGTALLVAAKVGDPQMVQLLLQAGANPNLATQNLLQTPLQLAAREGQLPVVKMLLQAGARDSADYQGRTAVDLAASRGHGEIAGIIRYYSKWKHFPH